MSNEYFNTLNYTLANEDTALENEILKKNAKHVMTVCGSGGRSWPLLEKQPRLLTLVDLSPMQLCLAELRIEAVRHLDYDEFMKLLGFLPFEIKAAERKKIFEKLSPNLTPESRETIKKVFESTSWDSLLYEGKWEKTFGKIAKLVRAILGSACDEIFECKTLSEQQDYLQSKFPRKRWQVALATLGQSAVFNALLYKGHFPKKNIPFTYYSFYKQSFDKLFAKTVARENFFLHIIFNGEIRSAFGNPIECDRKLFKNSKKALGKTEVEYKKNNIIDAVKTSEEPVSFLSLSDVPSYFVGDQEKVFMQEISPFLEKNSTTVVRNYQKIPWRPNLIGYENVTELYRKQIEEEKTQMYLIDIYRKIG